MFGLENLGCRGVDWEAPSSSETPCLHDSVSRTSALALRASSDAAPSGWIASIAAMVVFGWYHGVAPMSSRVGCMSWLCTIVFLR